MTSRRPSRKASDRDSQPKVALVHDWLTGMRGGEKCLELLCRRFPQADLFTLLCRRSALSPTLRGMRITTSYLQRLPGVARYYRYLLPLMPRAVESLAIPPDVDLVISLSHAVAKSVRVPDGVPHVCYCFTPMRYAWHLRDDYFADPADPGRSDRTDGVRTIRSGGLLATARNLFLDRIRRWDRATSGRPQHYVAISRTVAERIESCYGRPSTVIYPPVDVEYFTPADVPREDYYVCFSALVPYKKVHLAVEACNRLARRLIVIGDGPERARLERLAGPTVRFLGRVADDEVRRHLRHCRGLLFPGLEDFGIVPVEAQACGAPVVAYGRGGATETIIGATEDQVGSGVLFQTQTVDGLSDAIRWLEAHREQLSARLARQQSERFRVDRFQRELFTFLETVIRDRETPAPTADRQRTVPKQAA